MRSFRNNLTKFPKRWLLPLPQRLAPAPGVVDDKPGTVMEIYGHTMLDMGYQFNQNDPDWFDVVRPTKLPSFENEFGDDGNFFASVRQSRLGVKTSTPTSYGDLKTIFEFELFRRWRPMPARPPFVCVTPGEN